MPGYVNSAEMAMLNSILDEICLERGYGLGPDRDLLATQIMNLFLSGVSDRSELKSALRGQEPERRAG